MFPWWINYPVVNNEMMNLDWLLHTTEEDKQKILEFISLNSITFADPIIWNIASQYPQATIVLSDSGDAYLSKQPVPKGVQLNNTDYWLEIFNFADYVRTANSNLTFHIEANTTRATAAYNIDDWLLWDDVLYKVITAIDVDDLLIVGTNIVHFTVENFCRAWVTYGTNLINQYKNDIDASEALYKSQTDAAILQYKNDIDASELAYKNELSQTINVTTENLEQQLAAAIAGATVDSEVINARVGIYGVTYASLGVAIRTQLGIFSNYLKDILSQINSTTTDNSIISDASIDSGGLCEASTGYDLHMFPVLQNDKIIVTGGHLYGFFATYPTVGSTRTIDYSRVIETLNDTVITIPSGATYIGIRTNSGGSVTVNSYGSITRAFNDLKWHFNDVLNHAYINNTNLFDIESVENDYYYPYNTGIKTASVGNVGGAPIYIGGNTTYYINDTVVHVCYYDSENNFISGLIPSTYVNTTPLDAVYMRVSGGKTQMSRFILALGSEAVNYSQYGLYSKVDNFNRREYTLPYIHDKKVVCNRGRAASTAWYAGVDVDGHPDTLKCKFIWERGNQSGKVALISNPNGLTKISDITYCSLHLTLEYNYIKLSVLGNKYGEYYYDVLIEQYLDNNMVMDGVTENEVTMTISGNTVTVEVNNDTYTGTYTREAPIADVYGRYCTIEHFINGNRYQYSMPMFTYFEVSGGTAKHIMDDFNRENGILTMTPQGVPYTLMSEDFNFD